MANTNQKRNAIQMAHRGAVQEVELQHVDLQRQALQVQHRRQQTGAQDLGRRRGRHLGLREARAVQAEAGARAGAPCAPRPLRRLHPVAARTSSLQKLGAVAAGAVQQEAREQPLNRCLQVTVKITWRRGETSREYSLVRDLSQNKHHLE